MPRRGENIYKRRDGRWEGRILKENGRYQYFYSQTYKEVKEKLKDFDESRNPDRPIGPQGGKGAAELFESWLESRRNETIKISTYESYRGCLEMYILPFFCKTENRQITQDAAARFADVVRGNTAISKSYQKKILSVFKTALKAVLKGSPQAASVLEAVKIPKVVNREVQVFTMQEQRLIEQTVMLSEDARAFGILLCFYTGIRIGELCGLRWGDFDVEAGVMSVSRTVYRVPNRGPGERKTRLVVGTPKSQKSMRKIPLPAFLLPMIKGRRLYSENEKQYLISGKETPSDPRAYEKLYKRLLKTAGVRERQFHAIRHTFATRALELGVDIKTLSEILGHADISITLNIYAHSLMEQKKAAIDKLNQMHVTRMETEPIAVTAAVPRG